MHILLTDRLACPRCGPEFGLILLADRVLERRVLEGVLGCPNCRERYPVHGGFGDFRPPPRSPLPEGSAPRPAPDPDETVRLAALLGVSEGPGNLLLAGSVAAHARPLSGLVEEIEVVAVDGELRSEDEVAGVSRILAGRRLPFFSAMFRGVALGEATEGPLLDEAIRVVARLGRLVLFDVEDEQVVRRASEGGLEVLVHEDGVLVAART